MAPPLTETEKMLCIPVLAACITAGAGADAIASENTFSDVKYEIERAVSFSGARETCLNDLRDVVHECSEENWDGYDAAKLDMASVTRAQTFILNLPTDLPYPEVGAMPDGDVSLDWDLGARRSLTVVIGPQSRLAYAMILADEERSGTLNFVQEVPKSLIEVVKKLHRLV